MELNKSKVLKLLGLFDEAFGALMAIRREPKEKILSSRERFALEQLFYRLAMSAIDICFHLVAKRKAKVPDTYKNCFQHLLEEGLIDVETKQKLTELAGLRNLIAHVYWELDYERLYDYLDELESLEGFREMVLKTLEGNKDV